MNIVTYRRAGSKHVATISLEHQWRSITSYAAAHGHRIVASFFDIGYAGTGLWQALEVLADGEAQALLIHDFTRIDRGNPAAPDPVQMLREMRARLLTTRTGAVRLDALPVGSRSAAVPRRYSPAS